MYTGFWNSETKNANFVCLSATDENPENTTEEKVPTWTYKQKGGFYWAGSIAIGDAIIVGTDDGDSGNVGTSHLLSLIEATIFVCFILCEVLCLDNLACKVTDNL